MDIITKIRDGIHQDNNVYEQPENTMRDNLNGVITDIGNGNYKWSNIKGNSYSFETNTSDTYFAHCLIRDRLIVITLDITLQKVKLWEVVFSSYYGTPTVIWTGDNTKFNYSYDYPIRAIWGFYENENVQRIYLTDNNNHPRCFNIGAYGATVTIDDKFADFTPVIDHVYGKFNLIGETNNGSVKAGTVFFAWRYYTEDGYYTDWSELSNPVTVTDGIPGPTFDDYQKCEGEAPDLDTGKSIQYQISDIDTDYDNIQVCAFYSNDKDIAVPGQTIYDGAIDSTGIMNLTYYGNESFGTVTIDDLVSISTIIETCKDMLYAKKKNIIANVTERQELDLPAHVDASIYPEDYRIVMDTTGYPDKLSNSSDIKALTGMHSASYLASNPSSVTLLRGQWYKAITQVIYSADSTPVTIPTGNVFYISVAITTITYTSGTYKPCIIIKKYLKAGHDFDEDINVAYAFDTILLEDEFLDYKSPKVTHYLKGYPHGEQVRLGILFFDKTGRPFFIRHLRKISDIYGVGDITMLKRSYLNPLVEEIGSHTSGISGGGTDPWYDQLNGIIKSLLIDDLDLTDIIDQIGGFSIVRAPIVHQYLAMGILHWTYVSGNDVYSMPIFSSTTAGELNYDGCYDFYCPDDIFNAKGFALVENDEIENLFFLKPYSMDEKYTIGTGGSNNWFGVGRQESSDLAFYHKFFGYSAYADTTNGMPEASHKIKAVTKYIIGDDNLPINPLDGTKIYHYNSWTYNDGYDNHQGTNGNHSILMLDIDEVTDGIKGREVIQKQYPLALCCAVKHPNSDPYGGYSDSSIANSVYMTIGHYQEINTTVLNDIRTTVAGVSKYIFKRIQVFGGDTFLGLFDFKRIYENEDDASNHYGQSIIFPVESRMNLAMREGNHVAKTRSYDTTYNTSGLRMKVGYQKFEEFNYNDGYSSSDIQDYYAPMPFGYKPMTVCDARIRYSLEKSYGEIKDNFRKFRATDLIDLNPNKGAITNIKHRGDHLIYWQPDEIGYIPINERALTQSSAGQAVQLGVSGIFERYDQLIDKIGNSNQFGLIESPLGFHWYDARRKLFMNISNNLQITPDSILKGLDHFLQNKIPDDMYSYDNPFAGYGIFGGYDPMSKIVFCTFKTSGKSSISGATADNTVLTADNTNITADSMGVFSTSVSGEDSIYTIGIHSILNKFIGFFSFAPSVYVPYKGYLFEVDSLLAGFYIHGQGEYMNFFGIQYSGYVTVVIHEESDLAKIFDIFELIGYSNFFTSVLYENSDQSIEEIVANYDSGGCVIQNRNYIYRKRRWLANFPKATRERLADGYLKVTFKMDKPYLVELNEIKSQVRKFY
jgi:hypothetical protein